MQDVEIVRELMASLEEAIELADAVLPAGNYEEVLKKAKESIAGEKLYVDVVEAWGTLFQLDMTIEECSELIKAIQKFKRNEPGVGDVSTKVVYAMAEEVADVEVMCSVMRLLVGEEAVRKIKIGKLHRLRETLDKKGR